jgi:short-subunit dehydrogenase
MDHAQKNGITAEQCAKKIIKAVKKKKKEVYICREDILMIYFKRYIPCMYYKLVSKIKPT